MMPSNENNDSAEIHRERQEILTQLEDWLEGPMIALGFVWLLIVVIDLARGIGPFLDRLSLVIWGIFIFDFLIRFAVAPAKIRFLRASILTIISLMLPALRVLRLVQFVRVLRAARGIKGIQLVQIVTSLNRGMRALGAFMGTRGFGYVLALTMAVLAVGSAGMYAFEREEGLRTFGTALWWTAMLLTTMGSEYWPRTPEGRLLCLALAVYGFAVFGYVTATIASFFIGRDTKDPKAGIAHARDVRELREEVLRLQELVRQMAGAQDNGRG